MKLRKKIASMLTAMVCTASICTGGYGSMIGDAVTADTYEDSESTLLGDVSGNGEIDLQDAILIGKSILFSNASQYDEIGDYNGDGKCNVYDMASICKKLIGAPAVPSDSCNTFADVPGAGISVGSASAEVGSGTITLPLSLEGDLTSNGCIISVKYDDGLTFNYLDGSIVSNNDTPGEVKAAFVDPTGLEKDFASLEFSCPDTAGTYNVDVTVYALDYDGSYIANPVEVSGTITVTEEEKLLGDVSGNGELELQDAILIGKSILFSNASQYDEIGDYNGDGKCNLYDMIHICRYLINEQPVPSDSFNTFVDVPGAGISVGNASVEIGTDTVSLPLSLEGDITSYGCVLSVKYDDGLTLNSIRNAAASDTKTPGEAKAAFVNPSGIEKDFASLEFSCPDTAGTYNVDVTVYALDYDGSYVANPVEVGGTITVTAEEPAGLLSYEKIDTDGDGIYDSIEITGCDVSAVEVEIPAEIEGLPVVSIAYWELGKCTNLTSIEVSESNNYYSSVDGVLFNKDKTDLIRYPAAKTDSEYNIPEGVDYIWGCAFGDCKYLEKVTIPSGTSEAGYEVFASCSNLTSVTIPDGFKHIETCMFYGCTSLTDITIPDSVRYIGDGAFEKCISLTDITIPESVTSIGAYAFTGSGLTSITIKNPECAFSDEGSINETATIYGYANSTAQTYAETYGRKFVSLGKSPVETIPGDISGNGKIDLYDAIEICKSIMGMRSFTDEEKAIADYDGNGKVDLYDAIGIAKKLLEK